MIGKTWHDIVFLIRMIKTLMTDMTSEDKALMISLPYRVGIWISQVDDIENRKMDDKHEEKILEVAIQKMAQSHRKMPFAANIMKQVEKSQGHWKNWKNMSDEKTVLQDLDNILIKAEAALKPAEVKQYKQAVWQTGILVAQAYDENHDPDGEMHMNHFAEWLGNFFTAPKLKKAPENMSEKEKTALKKLRTVLKQ